ncbi:MAG: 2,3-bisphosphoglycerate-independent phosphoglycerate mutase [Candidatus Omnitrophota bacterium]|nr:2,3-bisphosphoglycerate-independent phosphoglycerate mutase [Candidatus Omnitrophota bacterium]
MKYIIVVMAGAADHPAEDLMGKTPLEVAKMPNLHYLTKVGRLGSAKLVTEHLPPGADTTLLNILGYNADAVYTGLGPIEAANLELRLEDNEIPFRMNFITEAQGVLADPTAGKLGTKEARALINFLNKKVANDFIRFFPGSEYRHIAVLKDAHGFEALSAKTVDPDLAMNQSIESNLPKGPGEELLKKMMYDAKLLLQDHEINEVRVDLGENPANMVWLWGQGQRPVLEKFKTMSGLSGALISGIEYAKGIARLAGLTVVEVPGGTGDLETNYEKKGKAISDALAEKDFVCVHVRACDEASRQGDLKAKIAAIEAIDFHIISVVRAYLERNNDAKVLITPGYAHPWKMHRLVRDSVPFVVAGKNVRADEVEKFSELAAKSSELKAIKSHELLASFLAKEFVKA